MTFNFNSNGLSCNAVCHVKGYYGDANFEIDITNIIFFQLAFLHVYLKSTGLSWNSF